MLLDTSIIFMCIFYYYCSYFVKMCHFLNFSFGYIISNAHKIFQGACSYFENEVGGRFKETSKILYVYMGSRC